MLAIVIGTICGLLSAWAAGFWGLRAADRLPGESMWPHCPFCLQHYKAINLIPLRSLYNLATRKNNANVGCACMRTHNAWVQPLIECTGAALGTTAGILLGDVSVGLVVFASVLGILPALAFIDISFGVIPNGLNICLGVLGLVHVITAKTFFIGLITSAGLLGLGLFLAIGYSKLRGKEMLGLGDVKFMAAAGLLISPTAAPWFLAIAGITGVIFGLSKRLLERKHEQEMSYEFPFAPSLCVALALCIIVNLAAPDFNWAIVK